jgi:hypothetical protein
VVADNVKFLGGGRSNAASEYENQGVDMQGGSTVDRAVNSFNPPPLSGVDDSVFNGQNSANLDDIPF